MESALLLLVGSVCVLFLIPYSDAIRCHSCNTHFDGGDCENKPEKFISNCTDPNRTSKKHYTQCRKIIQKVEGERRLIRQCAGSVEDVENDCIDRTGTHDIKITYCHCNGDLCNSSPKALASVSALVLAFIVRFL